MFGMYFQLSLAKRQILLLETLKVKQTILERIPSSLKLPISVSCYWLQHTESKAKLHHLQALLLGMLMGPLHAIITSPGRYLEIPGVYICMLLAYNHKFQQTKKYSWIIYSKLYPELRNGGTRVSFIHWQMFFEHLCEREALCCRA